MLEDLDGEDQQPVINTENLDVGDAPEDGLVSDGGTNPVEQEVETILFDGKPVVDEEDVDEEDEVLDVEGTQEESSVIRNIRKTAKLKDKAAKEANRALKEAQLKIQELEARISGVAPVEEELKPPVKPNYNDFNYDEEYVVAVDKYALDLAAYEVEKLRKQEKEASTARARQEEHNRLAQAYSERGRQIDINVGRSGRGKSFVAAEKEVASKLILEQQNILLDVVDNPADLVYVLGNNTKLLDELSAIKNLGKFAAKLGQLSTQIHVTKTKQETPPPPEKKISSSGKPTTSKTFNSKDFDKLITESFDTSDVTKLAEALRHKRKG